MQENLCGVITFLAHCELIALHSDFQVWPTYYREGKTSAIALLRLLFTGP